MIAKKVKESRFNSIDIAFSLVRISAFLGMMIWMLYHPLPYAERIYLLYLLAAFSIYTFILYALIFRFPERTRRIYFAEFILDLAALSYIVPLTGGFNSTFAYAFYLMAAVHSFYYGLLRSIGVALLSSLVYVYSCTFYLPQVHWTDVLLRLIFLLLLAVTLGFLSEVEREMSRKLVRAEQLAVMGTMSSQVAHAIRNPLSTISLSAELLADEIKKNPQANPAEANSLINSVLNEVSRINGVVEEFLQFARQPKLKQASCDINQLSESLIAFLDKDAERRKIFFVKHFEPDLPKAPIDERQLRQALINIIRNSFDAMPEGGEINIFTRQLKNEVEVKIEDDGAGISRENIKKMFEPFFSTKHMGMGVGLSIARDIILEHGGGISCESKEERGTTIKITLPVSS